MNDSKLLDSYLGNKNKTNKVGKCFTKILLCLIILFGSLIVCKNSDKCLKFYKEKIFSETFDFMNFKNIYSKFTGKKSTSVPVISSSFTYNKKEKYLDGEKYFLNDDIINAFSSGIVIYKGNKEGYDNTIIVQDSDGYNIWYGNIESDIKLYDYINKNDLLGSINEYLYLVIEKDNKYYSYEEYKNQI